MENKTLYTIGYANKSINDFIDILKENSIDCLVDVRSSPFSKQFPDYNEPTLKKNLLNNNIKYLSFKEEFGARRIENEVYTRELNILKKGNEYIEFVDFNKVYKLKVFNDGVTRILNGINKNYKIAFMCSEKKPENCHRAIMVGDYFYNLGYDIIHLIDKTGKINHNIFKSIFKINFEECFTKFKKNYKDDIDNIYNSCDLLGNKVIVNKDIEKWLNFFKDYDINKGKYLMNMIVGYKRGGDSNE